MQQQDKRSQQRGGEEQQEDDPGAEVRALAQPRRVGGDQVSQVQHVAERPAHCSVRGLRRRAWPQLPRGPAPPRAAPLRSGPSPPSSGRSHRRRRARRIRSRDSAAAARTWPRRSSRPGGPVAPAPELAAGMRAGHSQAGDHQEVSAPRGEGAGSVLHPSPDTHGRCKARDHHTGPDTNGKTESKGHPRLGTLPSLPSQPGRPVRRDSRHGHQGAGAATRWCVARGTGGAPGLSPNLPHPSLSETRPWEDEIGPRSPPQSWDSSYVSLGVSSGHTACAQPYFHLPLHGTMEGPVAEPETWAPASPLPSRSGMRVGPGKASPARPTCSQPPGHIPATSGVSLMPAIAPTAAGTPRGPSMQGWGGMRT